jgi:DNA ligase D-like protein (predicted ligase)
MLATLTHHYFSNKNWLFERKLDGERCIVHKSDKKVKLYSRNKKLINQSYPEIVDAIAKQNKKNFILDGEIVAFDKGITSFSKLQKRIHLKDPKKARQTKIKVYYYVFDVMYFDNYDTTDLPLRTRKKILKNIISFEDEIRYTIHNNSQGKKLLKQACKKGWEGLIAKKANSKYVSKRSKDWLKFKCINEQEFVIGGFTGPGGKRVGFGSLLLGYYEKDNLYYAGQVGTGFDNETLESLRKKFSEMEQKETPFHKKDKLPNNNVHWIKPNMVCEVGFTEWTESGKLRHPRFLGIRRDKPAKMVVREI